MIGYRCYFLGRNGKIHHVDEFIAANDSAATEFARKLFAEGKFPGIELWQGAKVVYVEGVSAPKSP
jgi:hypothetical protein